MKTPIMLLLFIISITLSNIIPTKSATESEIRILFEEWKYYHSKSQNLEEEESRFNNFYDNYQNAVASNNRKGITHTQGINQFSDLTKEEFKKLYLMKNTIKINKNVQTPFTLKTSYKTPPTSVDWCTNSSVSTPIKNQAQCGSCWAFSAIEALESREVIVAGNPLKVLSEQFLVSCDKVDSGCNGGLPSNAYDFMSTNGAILESQYPYTSQTGVTGTCMSNLPSAVFTNISGYESIGANSDDALEAAVAVGPVSIGVDAVNGWQTQTGGIVSNGVGGCQSSELDHGVVVCGYGVDSEGNKYWKVRNSWAASWGENGFIRLKRGNNANTCGLLSMPVVPKFD